jgi:hypothetical protein
VNESLYDDIQPVSREAAIAARDGEPSSQIGQVVLSVALHERDKKWATSFVLSVITHRDASVRGNAVLALGHIARIHRWADSRVENAVSCALDDPDLYVRDHARSAMDDIAMFARSV